MPQGWGAYQGGVTESGVRRRDLGAWSGAPAWRVHVGEGTEVPLLPTGWGPPEGLPWPCREGGRNPMIPLTQLGWGAEVTSTRVTGSARAWALSKVGAGTTLVSGVKVLWAWERVKKAEAIVLQSPFQGKVQAPVGGPSLVLECQGREQGGAELGHSRTAPFLTCSSSASFVGRCPVLRGPAFKFHALLSPVLNS